MPGFETPAALIPGPPPCKYAYTFGASWRSSRFQAGGNGYFGSVAGGGVACTAAGPCAESLAISPAPASIAADPSSAPAPACITSRRLNPDVPRSFGFSIQSSSESNPLSNDGLPPSRSIDREHTPISIQVQSQLTQATGQRRVRSVH